MPVPNTNRQTQGRPADVPTGSARSGGLDFAKLAPDRAAMGLTEDGREWTEALDDPALSRQVLGLE